MDRLPRPGSCPYKHRNSDHGHGNRTRRAGPVSIVLDTRAYLKQHSNEVDGFVILDDSASLDGLRSSQVKVDPDTGLQDADVDDALLILSGITE